MAELERSPEESDLQYHKRLIYGKLVDKTLSDRDYSELALLAYGQDYSSDVARRMFYGSKRTLELMDKDALQSSSVGGIGSELDAKIIEMRKERQRLLDQRREYNKLIDKDGRAEHLHSIIAETAEKFASSIGVMYSDESGQIAYPVPGAPEAVAVFSDWHYGMVTNNVFNKYNTEICRRRVQDTVYKMIEKIEFHACNTAHIVVLGDLFHGAIHVSGRVASEEVVCEQMMHAAEILAQSIYEISKHVREVRVYMTYGNHARTVQNVKDNIHSDNMERVLIWWLEERFRNCPNIVIVNEAATNEFLVLDVCGHGFCASHGDLDGVRESPRLLPTLFRKTKGIDVEYILLGDKHHRESFNELGITSLLCGALCGTDDYANGKRLYADASQLLLIVNERDGVDAEYRIKVG